MTSRGLLPKRISFLPAQPTEPEMREIVSVWLYEENGAFGFPRMASRLRRVVERSPPPGRLTFLMARVEWRPRAHRHLPIDGMGARRSSSGPLSFRCMSRSVAGNDL